MNDPELEKLRSDRLKVLRVKQRMEHVRTALRADIMKTNAYWSSMNALMRKGSATNSWIRGFTAEHKKIKEKVYGIPPEAEKEVPKVNLTPPPAPEAKD